MMVPDGFTDWAKPVGTGAFVARQVRSGRAHHAQEGAANYWKEGRGHLDAVDITVINDSRRALNALISGQVDAINRVDPKAVALLSKTPKIEIVRAPGGWYPVMAMQVDRPPYDNPDLRMALQCCGRPRADAQGAVQRLRHARQRSPDPDGATLTSTRSWRRCKYDPDKAKFHFKKAGVCRSDDRAADIRRRLQRRGRHGDAAPGERRQGRHQDRA